MTNSKLADELLPCPFCGSSAIIAGVTSGSSDALMTACGFCYTRGPRKDTEAEAIAAWNTRTLRLPETSREGVEGLLREARPYVAAMEMEGDLDIFDLVARIDAALQSTPTEEPHRASLYQEVARGWWKAVAVLHEAAETFRAYERHHRAKASEAGRSEKAERNRMMAEKCDNAIAGLSSGPARNEDLPPAPVGEG